MTASGTGRDAAAGTLVERAADYWAGAQYADVTPEAIRLAKRFLLDTLAAGIAGSGSDVVEVAIEAARAGTESTSGSAVLWGRDATLPAPQAALVNGTASHAYELDDFGNARSPDGDIPAQFVDDARRGAAACPERAITLQ